MRKLAALTLAGVLLLTASQAQSRPSTVRGPFLLVALPALGTVTWRCDPSRRPGLAPDLPGLALGFRAFRRGATAHLRLRVGARSIRERIVQPGEAMLLPYLRSRVQQLDLTQMTGAGTLRAFVRVEFAARGTSTYCYPYLPPRVEVRVLPRR